MEKYRIKSVDQITPEVIEALVSRFKMNEVPRLRKLFNYYEGKHDILNRQMNDPSKPNNKVVNSFFAQIVDSMFSYFIGVPVAYSTDDEGAELMERLQAIFDFNHEQSQNSTLAKHTSICGVSYQLVYIDADGTERLNVLSPTETFLIYDTSIQENIIAAVRFTESFDYVTQESIVNVEVYTKNVIQYYVENKDGLVLSSEIPHYFNDVPVIPFFNNEELQGDAEKVIPLIDNYDLLSSEKMNNIEYYANSYLVIKNADIELDDLSAMKENRLIKLPSDSDAFFLTKDGNDTEIESSQTRIRNDIHLLSSVPDLSDGTLGSASGISLEYRLLGLNNKTVIKQRNFTQSLEKRIKLLTNYFNLKGNNFDASQIVMQFTKNLPTNLTEIADLVTKLDGSGLVSKTTLRSLLSFVEDPEFEKLLIAEQEEDSINEHGTYDFTQVQPITTNQDVE